MSTRNKPQQPSTVDSEGSTNWQASLRKATQPGADWPDKDELLDVLYWGRQGFALVMGLAWGVVPFHGLLAIILYVAVTTVVGHLYITAYQKVDEDLVGGFWDVAKEGFGAAFATFMVSWIGVYSALHFD
uniref:Rab5-interacting protein n=1 Tax=Plectus sambesii TaxID=2011161 RepID=A0A914UYG1_9BILA